MKEQTRICAPLIEQVMAHHAPAVILNESGEVIFGNDAWLSYQKLSGIPSPYGLGLQYELVLPISKETAAGRYIRATIDQGVSEVLVGVQPLFCKECDSITALGPMKYRLTVTRCRFADGGSGAVVWGECISGDGAYRPSRRTLRRRAA
ncbi:hypothetical protein AB4Y45_32680 [Paraburkholderia sp. EG287A]|uniref:hypothetical protein n=1 Tax=Paraburkholderia sp. EG287A TaxID=3237012 RepID=UPI0034D2BF45